MLTSTFCCFSGVTAEAENRLWRAGVLSWHDFLREGQRVLSAARADSVKRQIDEAACALDADLWDYFLSRLPPAHRVRVLAHTHGREGYFDIETNGLGRAPVVTSIAIHTPAGTGTFVQGRDLGKFLQALAGLTLLVSYNGSRFDVPILERHFRMRLPAPHLDLCPVLRAMGHVGGLKACERRLGLTRPGGGARDGKDAVALWHRWKTADDANALHELEVYNAQDALQLRALSRLAYRASMSAYPIKVPPIS